jgi:hypothetical protein
MEHRESPEIERERADESHSRPGRRFARLVESPVSRRVALPRLIVALGLTALLGIGLWKLVQFIASWVERRPEHRIKFAQIELSPPPDPWVIGGTLRILQEVRGEGKSLDEPVSLLDLDLKELQKDFKRCVWVKEVLEIDRSQHGRLIVALAYRKPVAVIPLARVKPVAYILDEEAVVLPDKSIDWALRDDPYLVRGMTSPLIKIEGMDVSSPTPKVGLPWKRKVDDSLDDPDPIVLRAASLARFLQERRLALKSPTEAPDFKAIYLPDGPDEYFFLLDDGANWVRWGKAAGDEKPGDPSPEARWRMLLDWVKVHGPLVARWPKHLYFTNTGARLSEPRSGGKR